MLKDILIQAWIVRSISDWVVVGPRLTRTAARASCGRNSHGRQHVRGLDLAGGAGRARRHGNPLEIEGNDRGLRLHAATARTAWCWAAVRRSAPKTTRSGEADLRPASSRSRSPAMRAASAREFRERRRVPPRRSAAMPATFSVPARAPRSWPPPLISGAGNGTAASRRTSAPTPLGAPILCPESVRRSAPSALISQGILPDRLDRVDVQDAARFMGQASGLTKPVEQRRFRYWQA